MSLETRLSTAMTAIGAAVKALRTDKADLTVVARKASTESITGAWTFGTAPNVPAPSAAAHPVRNDDARNSNARNPTAHTHGTDQVTASPRTVAYGSALTSLAPASGVALDVVTCTLTGNPTITPAAGADGQVVRLRCLTSSARTVTFGTSVKVATAVTRSLDIPAGQAGVFGLEYISGLGWALFSAYATSI